LRFKERERLLFARQAAVGDESDKHYFFRKSVLIGRKYRCEVQRDKAWLPYEIRAGATGGVEVKMGASGFAGRISAFILSSEG